MGLDKKVTPVNRLVRLGPSFAKARANGGNARPEQSVRCEQRRSQTKVRECPVNFTGVSPDGNVGGETAKSLPGCKAVPGASHCREMRN